MRPIRLLPLVVVLLLPVPRSLNAATVDTLLCTADAAMNGHPQEQDLSFGGSATMRLKDYQGIPFLGFDFSRLRGRQALSCTLYVRSADGEEAFCTDLISTIAFPWRAGRLSGDSEPGASVFSRRVWPDSLWAGPESDARAAINGDHGSLVNSGNLCFPEGGGWAKVALDSTMARQLIEGEGHGLALFGRNVAYNRDIWSRERSGGASYLVLETVAGERVPPAAPRQLRVIDAVSHGRVTLAWTAPGDDSLSGRCRAYECRWSIAPAPDRGGLGGGDCAARRARARLRRPGAALGTRRAARRSKPVPGAAGPRPDVQLVGPGDPGAGCPPG